MQAIDEWDTVYWLSSEDKGIFCERSAAYYLLLGKAGGTVNDINIKKNYGRLHFRELP